MDKVIFEIERSVFEYDLQVVNEKIIDLLSKLEVLTKNLSREENKHFRLILNYINIAFNNKDYLLLADLLTYEMIPFINNMELSEVIN